MKRGGLTREGWIRLAVVVAFVLVFELLCRLGVLPRTVVLPPSEMATSLWHLLVTGEFTADIVSTLQDVAIASALSIALGFALGIAIHALPRLRATLEPLLASYYAIPTFMFYPVFIVVFGVSDRAIIAIAVLLSIVAMIASTLTGLDRIPRVLRKTAAIYRMGLARRALLIDLPAAAPHLFTGIKLAFAYAFIGVIASEFILSGQGIGYQIAYAYNNFENRKMYGLMLLVIIVATVANAVLDTIDRRLQSRLRR
ncbi:MAG: ABC transporter permease subunit [Pseudolabrys sp.]|nr:ABC transporter permease subunit [Pseudolabrys sp.]MCW5684614.1 ABC transporter permease subunit [Pseudolabrys sp.]